MARASSVDWEPAHTGSWLDISLTRDGLGVGVVCWCLVETIRRQSWACSVCDIYSCENIRSYCHRQRRQTTAYSTAAVVNAKMKG
jgi:hypothetical protein